MKAKVLHNIYSQGLEEGTIVEIVPGMEADGADVFNAPIGKCYLCRAEDGSNHYVSAISLQMLEKDEEDWNKVRIQAAISALPKCIDTVETVLMGGGRIEAKNLPDQVAICCCQYADALVERLQKENIEIREEE